MADTDLIHAKLDKVLDQVGDVRTNQAVIQERVETLTERFTEDQERQDKETEKLWNAVKPLRREYDGRQDAFRRVKVAGTYLGPFALLAGILTALSRFF